MDKVWVLTCEEEVIGVFSSKWSALSSAERLATDKANNLASFGYSVEKEFEQYGDLLCTSVLARDSNGKVGFWVNYDVREVPFNAS